MSAELSVLGSPAHSTFSRADSLARRDACAQLDPVILGRVAGIDALRPVVGWAGWWSGVVPYRTATAQQGIWFGNDSGAARCSADWRAGDHR